MFFRDARSTQRVELAPHPTSLSPLCGEPCPLGLLRPSKTYQRAIKIKIMMEKELKKRIMRRVYTIWFVRKAAPLATETAGLVALFTWALQYISPANIVANAISASDGFYAFFLFFGRSFTILTPALQFSFVATTVLVAIIARDIWSHGQELAAMRNKLSTG
ncbi:MAG: hypothetical protein HYW90_02475 [Candidatus Sungbacteria bacterium]|nr:hypothetical protein [Candidatus Sungbacteria bacterium]